MKSKITVKIDSKKLEKQIMSQIKQNLIIQEEQMQLTKDADKMLCCIYKTFLEMRKSDIAKSDARRFDNDYFNKNDKFSKWQTGDIQETLMELGRSGYTKMYIGGNFDLTDKAIIYMENRFKNGLNEVIDALSKLIP